MVGFIGGMKSFGRYPDYIIHTTYERLGDAGTQAADCREDGLAQSMHHDIIVGCDVKQPKSDSIDLTGDSEIVRRSPMYL